MARRQPVWGVSMVKNEIDVIKGVVRHMAGEVDGLLIADNGSTDGTRELLAALASDWASGGYRLEVVDDTEPGYYQSRKMTALARKAARFGAVWIVPFDADELWVGDRGLNLAATIRHTAGRADYIPARIFNHYETALDDPAQPDAFARMKWGIPGDPKFHKVAFRWAPDIVIEQGNHGVHSTTERRLVPARSRDYLELHHFPYRGRAHFVRKARQGKAAYDAAPDLPKDMGDHWRSYGSMSIEDAGEWYTRFFTYQDPVDSGLTFNPAPYRRFERGSS